MHGRVYLRVASTLTKKRIRIDIGVVADTANAADLVGQIMRVIGPALDASVDGAELRETMLLKVLLLENGTEVPLDVTLSPPTCFLEVGQRWLRVERPDTEIAVNSGRVVLEQRLGPAYDPAQPRHIEVRRIFPRAAGFGGADRAVISEGAEGFALAEDLDKPPSARMLHVPLADFAPSAERLDVRRRCRRRTGPRRRLTSAKCSFAGCQQAV